MASVEELRQLSQGGSRQADDGRGASSDASPGRLRELAEQSRPTIDPRFLGEGVARGAGAAVDLLDELAQTLQIDEGLQFLGAPESVTTGAPPGGRESIERALNFVGQNTLGRRLTPPEGEKPDTFAEGALRGVGDAAGGLLSVGGTARTAARGTSAVARAGRQALQDFASRPVWNTIAELGLGAAAGAGGEAAARAFPETDEARALGELGAGLGLPASATALRALPSVLLLRKARDVVEPLTPAAGPRRAGKRLRGLSADSDQTGAAQREATIADLTPAQRTGEKRFAELEATRRRREPEFDERIAEQQARANRQLQAEARDIGRGGTSGDARAFLQGQVERAARQADERLAQTEPTQREAEASRIVREELDKAEQRARQRERQLFDQVPQQVEVPTQATRETFADILRERDVVDDPEDVPSFLTELVGRVDDDGNFQPSNALGETASVQRLQRLRSRVLREQRKERAAEAPNRRKLSILNDMQDAILDDLDARASGPSRRATDAGQEPAPPAGAREPGTSRERKPVSPIRALQQFGGVQDTGGEIAQIIGGPRGRPGLINNRAGMAPDEAAETLRELGFFPGREPGTVTSDEMFGLIDEEMRGRPQFALGDEPSAAAQTQRVRAENRDALEAEASRLGVPSERIAELSDERLERIVERERQVRDAVDAEQRQIEDEADALTRQALAEDVDDVDDPFDPTPPEFRGAAQAGGATGQAPAGPRAAAGRGQSAGSGGAAAGSARQPPTGGGSGGPRAEVGQALRRALDFSRDVNERFAQGAVGRVLGFERRGGPQVPPESTLETTVGRSGQASSVNTDQLLRAVEDAPEQTREQVRNFIASRFRQSAIRNNELDVQRAQNFLENNQELLDRFPDMAETFRDAASGQLTVDDLRASSIGRVLNARDGEEIDQLMRAQNPRQAAREVVREARRDETGASVQGLKSALIQRVLDNAKRGDFDDQGQRLISGRGLRAQLQDRRIRPLLDTILSDDDRRRLGRVAREFQLLEQAQNARTRPEGLISDTPNTILSTAARIIGAQAGGAAGQASMGGSIQTANILSGRAKQLVQRLTNDKAEELIRRSLEPGNEELFRTLITDLSGKPRRQRTVNQRLNAYLAGPLSDLVADDEGDEAAGENAP